MAKPSSRGCLIIIGGREDRRSSGQILQEISRRARGGRLVLVTLATEQPDKIAREYRRAFSALGVKLFHLGVRNRNRVAQVDTGLLRRAKVILFSGGDQLKLTSELGGTPLCDSIRELYVHGATLAGTSSGASAMSDTMIVSGRGEKSPDTNSLPRMAPGLAFIQDVVIDQHFAERGRIGRLIAVIAENPRVLGIGIDEDTAVVLENGQLSVIGSGGVYVVDGRSVTYSNVADHNDTVISAFNVTVHLLSDSDRFDIAKRVPIASSEVRRKAS
jgi:cyanophycinase